MCIKTLPVQQNVRKTHTEVRKREGKKKPQDLSLSLSLTEYLVVGYTITTAPHLGYTAYKRSGLLVCDVLLRAMDQRRVKALVSFSDFSDNQTYCHAYFFTFSLYIKYLLISYITQLALHQVLLVYLRPLLQFDLLLCYFLFFFSSYNHQWRNSKTSLYYFNNYFFLSFFIFMFFFACKFKCVWFAMACTHEQQQKN